ncbi:MAG: hypothetical protein A2X86_11055 [Bdellovibrionales bacterium GWA2_49_15]|nr:MAG: hypothetical protein A2X86_11055 [Bdellovibrionales bacterium GWA2_49_15]HAZ12712.1 hypothetical protein [Bdellovibrionales bacterium]
MKTKILLALTTLAMSHTVTAGDIGSCSIDCENSANEACKYENNDIVDILCYSAAFWGCMAGCTQESKSLGSDIIPPHRNLLKYTKCSDAEVIPACSAIGTRSEGWYLNGRLMTRETGVPAWDMCQEKNIYCQYVGTPLEGWYIYE